MNGVVTVRKSSQLFHSFLLFFSCEPVCYLLLTNYSVHGHYSVTTNKWILLSGVDSLLLLLLRTTTQIMLMISTSLSTFPSKRESKTCSRSSRQSILPLLYSRNALAIKINKTRRRDYNWKERREVNEPC